MANVTTATYPGRGIIWNRMKGNGTEALNLGWGAAGTVTSSANANVNLFAPQTEARTAGTSTIKTTTQLGDTYQVVGTIVCAGSGKTITEVGLFDTATLSGTSTLSASLTAGATSMTLGANIGPTTGNFYAQVNNEVILVTGANSATLTIARGQLGTTSTTQAAASPVTSGGDGGAGGWTTGQTATYGAGQGGNMFIHADYAGIALNVNDSIAYTVTDTLTALFGLGLMAKLAAALGLLSLFC